MENNSASVSPAASDTDVNTVPNPTIHNMLSVENKSADDKRIPIRNGNAMRYGLDPTRNLSATDTAHIQTMEVHQCQNVVHYPTPTELNVTQNNTTMSVSIPTGGEFTATIIPVSRSSTTYTSSVADYKKDITQHNAITGTDNEMASQFKIVTQQSEYHPSQLAHNSSTMILPTQSSRKNCDILNRVATIGTLEESHSTDKRSIVNKADNATQGIYGGGVTYCYPAAKHTARVIKVKHESRVEPSQQTTLPEAVTHSYPFPGNHAVYINTEVKTTMGITVSHNNQTTPGHTSIAHMPTGTTHSTHGRIIIPNKHVKYRPVLSPKKDVNKFIYIRTSLNDLPGNSTATNPKYTTTNKASVSAPNCNPSFASSGNTTIVGSLNTERNVIVRLPRPEDIALGDRVPHRVHTHNSESPDVRVSLNNSLNVDGSTPANCTQLSPNSDNSTSIRHVDCSTVTKGNVIVPVTSANTGPYSAIHQGSQGTTLNTVGLVQSTSQSSLLSKKQRSDYVNSVIPQYHYSPTRTTMTTSFRSVQTSCVSSTVTQNRPLIRTHVIPHLASSSISPTISSRGIPSTVQPKYQIIPSAMQSNIMSLTTMSQSTTSAIHLASHVISSTVKPHSILSAVQPAANNIPSALHLTSHSIPSVLQPVSRDIPSAMQLTSTSIPGKGMSQSIPSSEQFAPQSLSFVVKPTPTSRSIQSAVQHVSQCRSSAVQLMSHGIPRKNIRHSIPIAVQHISQGLMSTKQSVPQSIQSNKSQCTPLIKTSRAIENVQPNVSLHTYVNSRGVIFPIYNRKRPDLRAKSAKVIENVLEKCDSFTSQTTAYPLFALSSESSDKRQWSKYLKIGDVSVMDDVCEHQNVPSHRTLSSDMEGIGKVFDEDLNRSTSDTDKPVQLHSKKMLRNAELLQKSCQKESRPGHEKKINFPQPHEEGCVDMSWYSEMSKLLKEFQTNKVTVPAYVTVQNERYVINCLDSHTSDNDPENTGYANSKLPGQRYCEEDIHDGGIVNLNRKKVHMNSGVGVKCSSVIGNKRSTTHVVPFTSTDSTNAGCIPDWDSDGNFTRRSLDDVEPNFTQEMVDNDRPTPVLLIPNVHFVSSQHEVNEVNNISDPFEVSSYLGDPLTRNSGTENSVLDHDRVQCEQLRLDNITVACTPSVTHIPSLSEIVSSSPGVNVKSEHVDTISPYAVIQELVSVIKQEEETEMLNNKSVLPTTQFISPPEVKMESMVHDSDGEDGNVEPIFYDDRNLSDVSIPIFKIKKEPLDIYTSLNENGSEIAQQSLFVGNLESENHAIKREPPDSICSLFPSDIEIQSRQQDILRTNDTDHTSAPSKIDRLSECCKLDSEIQEQTKEMLRHHLKRKADQLHYSNTKVKINTPVDKMDRSINDEYSEMHEKNEGEMHNLDTEDIVHKQFKVSRNVSELSEKRKLDTKTSSNKTFKIYTPVSKSEINQIHDSSTWDVLNNTLLPTPVVQLDVFDEKRNVIGKTVGADFYDETDGNILSSFMNNVVIQEDSSVGIFAKTNVGSTCSGMFHGAYDPSVRKMFTESCDISSNTILFSGSSTSGTAANKDGCVRQSLNITACITPNSWEHSYSIQPTSILAYQRCSTRSGNNASRPKRNEHFPYGLKKNNTTLSRNTNTSLYNCIQKEHTYSVDNRPTGSNIHVGSDLNAKSSYGVSSKYVECQTDAGDNKPTSSNIHVGSDLNVKSSYGVSSKSVECQTDTGESGWISLL